MSTFILSHDSHLMMLEIAVENLFVPWTTAFDKIILKKTVVMFRMLDKDWISLSPNRRDGRPYRGSNCENEKFYGGGSVVFSVPTNFFGKEASGVDIQLHVRKQVCKYFEMVSRQRIGFATVPVDNLLNSIAKQIRERNELAEHLSDFYKRQIISRSTMGTYTLLDENFRNTAATISLYIRISYLGKCLITEITEVKSIRGAFYVRGDSDEKQPYFSRQLRSKELQSGCWLDSSFPRVPRGTLICRCKELVKKKATDLAKNAVKTAAIKRRKAPANKVADSTAISVPELVADAGGIEREKPPADTIANSATIKIENSSTDAFADSAFVPEVVAADDAAIKIKNSSVDAVAELTAISVAKVAEDVAAVKEEAAVSDKSDFNAAVNTTAISVAANAVTNLDMDTLVNANERTNPIMAIHNEVTNEQAEIRRKLRDYFSTDVKADAVATTKTKGYAIRNNGERAFKKAFPASNKSKLGRNTATIGITERGKRILTPPSPPFSRLQTYPLRCQLQPHLTCFTDYFDVSSYYCYWTACPLQFFHSA